MSSPSITLEKECPRKQLAPYIDGELLPHEELELELHLAACKTCAAELNEQKKLLFVLDFALDKEDEIELPADFTKIVVAKAESNVSGLRSPRERYRAILVCSILFLFGLIGLGGQIESVFASYIQFTEQVFSVFGFIFHLIYNISIGTAVVLRSLSSQFVSVSAIVVVFLVAFSIISLLAFSRLFIRLNRV